MNHTFIQRLSIFILLICTGILHASNAESLPQNVTSTATSSIASRNFWQLNEALTAYQNASQHPWPVIPDSDRLLKMGVKSKIIPLLRERLRLSGDLSSANDSGGRIFDAHLKNAVQNFQIRHGLKSDGVVGNRTITQLNIPPEMRVKQIALNMQRWANLTNQLGDRFIMVNIPDFHMYLVDHGQLVLNLRVIVGKPNWPTPELTSRVTRIIFNPYWNIPHKIAQNEIVPKMLEDPNYIYRTHIRAFRHENNNRSQIDPSNIDWQQAAENGLTYHLRQDPGEDNALGEVKFEFQNNQSIYMHDTSAKHLFNADKRDFSHGCIRLENPFSLAEYLMKDDPKWDDAHIQAVFDSSQTKYIRVKNPVPIFIAYLTAWVDEEGRVNFRDDIYQLDNPEGDPNLANMTATR